MASEALNVESVLGPIDEDINLLRRLIGDVRRDYKEGEQVGPDIVRRIEAQLLQVPGRIKELEQLQREHPAIARELERIKNLLMDAERGFRDWKRTNAPPVLESLETLCQEELRELRVLRVPMVINDSRLRHLRVGTPFDFLKEYQQELSEDLEKDLRPEVLRRLKQDVRVLGWVDEEAGIIYRASPNLKRRLLSFALVFGIPVLGLIGYVAIAPLLQAPGAGWNGWAVGINYLAFLAGYVAHVVKKAMEGSKSPMLDDLVSWIHVRESQLTALGLSLWMIYPLMGGLGLFPDLGLFRQITSTTVMTALAAGFSIDSLAAGALKHYQRRISEQAAALKSVIAR